MSNLEALEAFDWLDNNYCMYRDLAAVGPVLVCEVIRLAETLANPYSLPTRPPLTQLDALVILLL